MDAVERAPPAPLFGDVFRAELADLIVWRRDVRWNSGVESRPRYFPDRVRSLWLAAEICDKLPP
jgi:hypothetical protein